MCRFVPATTPCAARAAVSAFLLRPLLTRLTTPHTTNAPTARPPPPIRARGRGFLRACNLLAFLCVACVYVCVHVCVCVCVHVCVHVCMRVRVCERMYVECTYICTEMLVHTHCGACNHVSNSNSLPIMLISLSQIGEFKHKRAHTF
jgi:hypothetical protein